MPKSGSLGRVRAGLVTRQVADVLYEPSSFTKGREKEEGIETNEMGKKLN